MNWYKRWRARRQLITKISPQQIAIPSLQADQTRMEVGGEDVHQVELNIITDKLRRYLGEQSTVYVSFSRIDISIPGNRFLRLRDAAILIEAAVRTIEDNGLYEDYQMQLVQLNIKQAKSKIWLAIGGAIGGAVLSNLKDIGKFLLSLLHLLHK
jgi:hypothetical protein